MVFAGRSSFRRTALETSVSIAVLILGISAATAQQQAPAAATAPRAAANTALDEITVTASKQEERAIDALAAVSVITRQEIRQQQTQRLGTIISQTPGVTTQENPNDPATAINIRGLQDFGRVAVTVDGARQNFQRSGHNANGSFFLDPSFVRAIDITRGPVANIYGSGAIGGVVSFETVDPKDILKPGERFAGELGATGLFGRQQGWFGSAIGAIRPNDAVEALVGTSSRNLGNYRDGSGTIVRDTEQDLKSAIAKLVLKPAEGHQIKFGAQYQNYDFTNGTGTATAPRRNNEVNTSNMFARYSFSRPDVPWLNLNATVYRTTTDTDQTRTSGTAAQQGQWRFFKIATTGFDINNTTKLDFGGSRLDLTYGMDYFQDRVRTLDVFSNGDELTPTGKRTVSGGFFQGHYKWSIVDVIGALRYDNYELSSPRTESSGNRLSPKITVGITPLQGLQFYGTYAEGYRAPSVTEALVDGLHPAPSAFRFIPNPNLRPEIGKTLEAGLNIKYDDILTQGDRLRGKISVYRNDVRDYIDGVFNDPGNLCNTTGACGAAFYTYTNVANARLTGVEADIVYDARSWFASVAGSINRGDNRTIGQPLQSIYPDKLVLGAGLRYLDEKLTIGTRVMLVDAQKRVPASVPTSKAYTLVELYANYQILPDTRAYLTLENIGDVRYQRYRDSDKSSGFVGKVGLTTRFGT